MFDFVRKHTKIMMFVMFLLIIPSFVLFGIDGYKRFREGGEVVAQVAGHEVTQGEWDSAHKSESDRMRASLPNLDPKLLDSPDARFATLERLIHEKVLAAASEKFRLSISDLRLARDLQANPTIASLRSPDGKLDMERYRELVASQGLTPEGFEARVRNDISIRQVEGGVTNTGFAAQSIASVSLNAFFEKREVQIANFMTADYASKVSPTDVELDAFYQANKSLFQAPEQASIEYVVLDLDAVRKNITVSEAELKSYYEQNASRLSGNEERRASHILIEAAKTAPASDREKAKARADDLLAQVRKSPESFAELAKKNSQDSGSALKGGDLDFFARGAMVKPVEDAVFTMNKGDISGVVESDFGYHIIKLTDVKKPVQRSFEELRGGIESDLKTQQSQRKFAETAEAFTNGVYEQSDNLKSLADKLKLEIKVVANLQRKPQANTTGVLANTKFLTAIFSPDSVEKKRNTEAIETATNQLVAGRVTQYVPSRVMPLADVKNDVRARVVSIKSAELAKKEGLDKLALWKASPASAVMPAEVVLSRDQSQNTPQQILNVALQADSTAFPTFVGVDLGAKGFAVVKINKVLNRPEPVGAAKTQELGQYSQMWTAAENQAYYAMLKDRFKVKVLVSSPLKTAIDFSEATSK
jgi:peptidyl-prolyl cis-trans isomerase D